jgi:tungstate transport system permease protein
LSGDAELYEIIVLSLRVSLTAVILACLVGAPLGLLLAMRAFPGRRLVLVLVNALLGLPPVVVGLIVYLMVSRAGPLGSLGLLFTPSAMVLAQFVLTLPIAIALTHRLAEPIWLEHRDALRVDGARLARSMVMVAAMGRAGFVTVFLTAFGRAIAEVGAIMVVGGNIRGHTRTMTTAIALETSRGDLALALGLGLILVSLSIAVSALAFAAGRTR